MLIYIKLFSLVTNKSAADLQHYTLPPKYVDIFDETTEIIKDFNIKRKINSNNNLH